MKKFLRRITGFNKVSRYLQLKNESSKILLGKILINQNKDKSNIRSFAEVEFSVFSQLGDDGIIQYLIDKIPGIPETFVEFGVQDYSESNTRFLLINNNWSGLVMDSSSDHINTIKQSWYYWMHDLNAVEAFITRENINELLSRNFPSKEIGILHIDIDGNDYWIWDSIKINPVLVIVEYNSAFGLRPVTIPYKADFGRYDGHFSGIYFGASLKAFHLLAEKKGYSFIGTNSYGNNAYFLRNDMLNSIKEISIEKGFTESKCRQNKDKNGAFTFVRDDKMIHTFKDLKVYNIETDKEELFNN